MPSKQLGAFLNSTTGFWAISAGLSALVFAGRSVMKRFIQKEYRNQFTVILTLTLVSAVFLVLTLWFPIRGEVPASVVPRLWIIGIFACLAYLMIKILNKTEGPDEPAGDLSLPIKFMAATVGYIVLMVLVGYFIASLVFLLVTMSLLSYRRRLIIVAIGCGWMAFSYLVFYRVLYVPLPQGLLFNALFG